MFKAVDGSYVYKQGKVRDDGGCGKCDSEYMEVEGWEWNWVDWGVEVFEECCDDGLQIYKVPSNDVEALKSPLMGLFEKRRARKFFIYVQNYEEDDVKTHEGMDLRTVTTKELFK